MNTSETPGHGADDNSSRYDNPIDELTEVSSLLAKIRHDMIGRIFSFDEAAATPDDRENELGVIADELERVAIRCVDVNLADPLDEKIQIMTTGYLDFAADTLRDLADDMDDLDSETFIACLDSCMPPVEEAEIVLTLLCTAHGQYRIGPDTYLHKDGLCGFSPKKHFSIASIAGDLERALIDMDACTIGDGFISFDPEKKVDLTYIGEEIKKTLECIVPTLTETRGDAIEQALRLVSVQLQAVLVILREELELPQRFFYSKIIADALHREVSGGFCLERIKQNKLTDNVLAVDELQDAVTIVNAVRRIAEHQP
jgi:hypothetical protein